MTTRWRVSSVLCLVFAASIAAAQTCEPAGEVYCGAGCSGFFDLITDGHFEDGCTEWSYGSGVSRGQFGMSCGTGSYQARITGPTSGWQGVEQYVMADQGVDSFDFSYSVDIDDP